jgi:hypothetical protein
MRVGADDFPAELGSALTEAWDRAEALREPLRASARRQVDAGHDAYRRFARLALEEAVA